MAVLANEVEEPGRRGFWKGRLGTVTEFGRW